RMRERAIWTVVILGLLGALKMGRSDSHHAVVSDRARSQAGVRISMDALHQQGGVPLGWQMMPAPGDPGAGRQTFVDFGCHSCHRVAGESFSAVDTGGQLGPELTGMGSHHPPAYFAEAILNPDAVVID